MASKPPVAAFEAGSPIHNGQGDDDLDFAKELLDGGGGMNNGGSNPMLEHSRIEEGSDFVPPPQQPVRKPLPPPKAPVLSFSEMIAQAAAGLKKNPAGGDAPKKDNPVPIPKKGGADKEESKKEAPQARTSNMEALKAQINLRRLAMNPGNAKKGEDGQDEQKRNNLAALSMKMSKFGHDEDEDEDRSSSSDDSDDN